MPEASNPIATPVHEPSRNRWTVTVEDQLALLDYTVANGVMKITHTEVPQALGGRGIAGQLVRAALDFARAQGYRVNPACEYAAAWMTKHPQYEDLRAG